MRFNMKSGKILAMIMLLFIPSIGSYSECCITKNHKNDQYFPLVCTKAILWKNNGSCNWDIYGVNLFMTPQDNTCLRSTIIFPKSGDKFKETHITVKGTASDDSKVIEVEVSLNNGVTWHTASGTETWSYEGELPRDGIYIIRSRATDDEGNVELEGDKVWILIDNTPPMVTIDTELDDYEHNNAFQLEGRAIDNDIVKRVEITTDGGITWTQISGDGTWTWQWGPVDGEYILQVRAYDDLGHVGYSELIQVTIDTTPPALYIDTPDRSEVTAGEPFLITGTANDEFGVDYVEIVVGEEGPYVRAEGTENWSYQWIVLEQTGKYPVYVRAWDMAGLSTFQEFTLIVVGQPGEKLEKQITLTFAVIVTLVVFFWKFFLKKRNN